MTTRASHFIDITPTQTHIVVLSQMQLVLQADHARAMAIDGVHLAAVSGTAQLWQWHTHRRVGHHVLVIDRDDEVQVVAIECIDASTHRSFVGALHDQLYAIDVRLCGGQSAWQAVGIQLSLFESLLGMTSEAFLRTVLRAIHAPAPHTLQEWQGDTPARMRLDRVVVRDSGLVPFVYQSTAQRNSHVVIAQLTQVIDVLATCVDAAHIQIIHAIRQRLLAPIGETHDLVDLLWRAEQALVRSRQAQSRAEVHQTADVALLYERWVWVVVLRALGCDVTLIPRLIDGDRVFVSDAGINCAYQRRLAPTHAMTGWSRDARVAVPDVMLWQEYDGSRCRALVIDVKCSLVSPVPDASALNDVTAYLRRIGVGDGDPDAAVLVHPGSVAERWPSGLVVVGTRGVMADALTHLVQRWVAGQI